jgi:hypothetical protein
MTKEATVTLKSNGQKITVYRSSQRDTWINSKDLSTEYKLDELIF